MQVDYIIVGQGICGTFLSYYLIKEKQSVWVIDNNIYNSASRVASGVINPVTGRRIVKTWKIDELMPFAKNAYEQISNDIRAENIIKEITVLDIHTSMQMQQAFEKRLQEKDTAYLHHCKEENLWKKYFEFDFGIGEIHPAYCIDLQTLLIQYRNYIDRLQCLSAASFDINELTIKNDGVNYKNISARKIIFCDGINSINNSYFNHLPFAFNKGEALIVSIPDLPRDFIYKQGFSIVPFKDDFFWIGSTYEWNYESVNASAAFKTKVENYLKDHLKLPYKVVDHLAALRPANTERRPFVGLHEKNLQIGILNGMGTKGCSLAPYYAKQLTQHILYDTSIDVEADVKRFDKII
ncbi:MAG: FAD-dependent oxidoreductase [Arachidicoccus sp.]|nr:FAD-dependent oxidoreductase [Arachidicoccus sp.]